MDINAVYVGTVPAPLVRGGGGGALWPPADDEMVHTATMAAPPSTGYVMGGGGFVQNGNTSSPSEASLAAPYCSIPPEDICCGGREEHHDRQQQSKRHPVYDYPPASSSWSSDSGSSPSREGSDYDWGPWPHKESWQAINQGFEDYREERVETVRRDGGSAGARDHGDGIPAKRQAGMHAFEQALIERTQGSKHVRSTTTPAPPVTAHGMVFPPPSRDLSHLLQDKRIHSAPESISITLRAPTGVPMNGTTDNPLTAVRRRRCSSSPQEVHRPFLPARQSDEQDHGVDRKRPFERDQEPPRRRARAAAVEPTVLKAGRKNVGNPCQQPGCSRGSTYGAKGGAKKPTRCATHKRHGMVKITSRQCADKLCSTAPSYGFQGKRASFCSIHKMPGMVNVVTPRCQGDGCDSCASFGHATERRPLFCARHAQDGMVNVVSRKCLGAGCIKNPSYGHPGDRRASFCVDHQLDGMSNIVSPKCLAPGCRKTPSFGESGARKASWCKTHKQEGMINLLYSRQVKKCRNVA